MSWISPPRPGWRLAEHVEDLRVAHVAPDHDPPARRRARRRLLHQVRDHDHVVFAGGLDGRAAVQGDLLGIDLHQGDDAAAELVPDVDHPGEQRVLRIDEVIAEQHRERLVPHVLRRAQHGVAEPPGDRPGGRSAWWRGRSTRAPGELVPVLLRGQRLLELVVPVEVIFDGALAPARDKQDIVEARSDGLLHDILNRRLVDDRQHFLGRRFCRWQEPRSQPGGGHHGFGYCWRPGIAGIDHGSSVVTSREQRARHTWLAARVSSSTSGRPAADKASLRRRLVAARAAMSDDARAAAARLIRDHVLEMPRSVRRRDDSGLLLDRHGTGHARAHLRALEARQLRGAAGAAARR